MSDFFYEHFIAIVGTIIAILIAGVTYAAINDSREWAAFSQAHDCKVVAKHAGTTGYGMTYNGKMGFITTGSTTTYRCNDGVEYTR